MPPSAFESKDDIGAIEMLFVYSFLALGKMTNAHEAPSI